jgi:hypothetical protein
MPFLTRKSGAADTSALMQGSLGAVKEMAWGEDEYRPSKKALV